MSERSLDLKQVANRVIETCESTNDLARALGEAGYPQGTWVSAREQTRGRGRHGRVWQAGEGNLYLSMVSRIADPALWTWIPLMTAVCAARASEASTGLRIGIKWPNDLFVQGAKAGGILCEGVSNATGPFVVIGLGLNSVTAPSGLDQPTSALDAAAEVETLRVRIVEALQLGLARLVGDGTSWVREAYEARAVLATGTPIEWSGRTGKVIGLGESAQLRVIDSSTGEEASLFAEDVRVRGS